MIVLLIVLLPALEEEFINHNARKVEIHLIENKLRCESCYLSDDSQAHKNTARIIYQLLIIRAWNAEKQSFWNKVCIYYNNWVHRIKDHLNLQDIIFFIYNVVQHTWLVITKLNIWPARHTL